MLERKAAIGPSISFERSDPIPANQLFAEVLAVSNESKTQSHRRMLAEDSHGDVSHEYSFVGTVRYDRLVAVLDLNVVVRDNGELESSVHAATDPARVSLYCDVLENV